MADSYDILGAKKIKMERWSKTIPNLTVRKRAGAYNQESWYRHPYPCFFFNARSFHCWAHRHRMRYEALAAHEALRAGERAKQFPTKIRSHTSMIREN